MHKWSNFVRRAGFPCVGPCGLQRRKRSDPRIPEDMRIYALSVMFMVERTSCSTLRTDPIMTLLHLLVQKARPSLSHRAHMTPSATATSLTAFAQNMEAGRDIERVSAALIAEAVAASGTT